MADRRFLADHGARPGETVTAVGVDPFVLRSDVPRGHKVARRPVPADALVHKYGQVIGVAAVEVGTGDHVHLHNLRMPGRETRVLADTHRATAPAEVRPRTFLGIRRPDGRVATRNYIGVLTTAGGLLLIFFALLLEFSLKSPDRPPVRPLCRSVRLAPARGRRRRRHHPRLRLRPRGRRSGLGEPAPHPGRLRDPPQHRGHRRGGAGL